MNNPTIGWSEISGKKSLKFTFTGQLTVDEAIEAIGKWRTICSSKIDGKIVMVWDCLEMTGYDPQARNEWQKALKEMKIHIDSLWVVSESSLIRMGTMAMAMFASYKIKVVASSDLISL